MSLAPVDGESRCPTPSLPSVRTVPAGRPALQRMLLAVAARWLARQGKARLQEGCPPMAIHAFDLVGLQIQLRGRYEREELEAVMQLIAAIDPRPRGLCIDIGANVGNHALFFAAHYPQVWAFEPQPRTHALLALNAQLAPAGRVRAFPLGLSDAPGQAWIDLPAGNAGMARVSDSAGEMPGRAPCTLSTLDEVCAAQALPFPVRLVKIDVEGHEARVLAGGRQTLRRDRPLVLLEQAAEEFRDGSTPALDELRALGYSRFVTLEPWPAEGSRWGTRLSRLLRGEGYRCEWRERLPARFYSMIVAVPDRWA